jgi:hypothetical protein
MGKIISLIAGMITLSGLAQADAIKAEQMTTEESKKVANALETLRDSEVITKDSNGKFDLDKDIIQKLKVEGYLKKKRSDIQTICGGTGGHQ